MPSIKKIVVMSLALISVLPFPAMAEEKRKMREVKELVGYKETVVTSVPVKDEAFRKLDTDTNGVVTFTEFRRLAKMSDAYDIFLRIDTSRDKLVSMEEYREFNKTKGPSVTESSGVRTGQMGDRGMNRIGTPSAMSAR